VALRTDSFDLEALRLSSGEGRRIGLHVGIDPFQLAGEPYPVLPELVPVRLDISRTTGQGYALRLRFAGTLTGPCMRCLQPAAPTYAVDALEVSQRADSEELDSPYVDDHGVLDLAAWARDALALALPAKVLCRDDCLGLCPVCGEDVNNAGPEHHHEREPDLRWAKLSEFRFD
jgi:uncharacterized protein